MSSDAVSPGRHQGRVLRGAALALLVLSVVAHARVLSSFEDAVARRLPGTAVERQTVFITAEQREQVGKRSGAALKDEIVYPYVLRRDGAVVATAYMDVHRVRTLPEKMLVLVAPDGKLLGIEVLAFSEPPDYLAPTRWYDRLTGRALDDTLRLGKGVDGVTGATLTCRAAVDCARRILAVHAVLNPK